MKTTTETKHTPTPWKLFKVSGGYSIEWSGAYAIAQINWMMAKRPEAAANAAFIVRACNEHAALRETISALLSVLPNGNEALQIKAEKLLRGEV